MAMPGAHDLLISESCDASWNPAGAAPQYCEHACLSPPVQKPCNGKTPCLDQDPCSLARDAHEVRDCPSTFTATDGTGPHRGCCLIRTITITLAQVPSFYECPPS